MNNLVVAAVFTFVVTGCGSDDSSPRPGGPSGTAGSGTGGTNGTETGGAGGAGTGGMNGSGTGGASGGGAGGMDAGGSGGVGGTGGSGNVPSWAEPVSHTSEGVLTNHPEFQFSTSGDFAVTSAYFILTQRSTFNSFTIFGDFENRGAVMRCVPLVTITVGDTPVTSVGNGPVYESSSFIGANFPCFPPGAAGVFNSIANDVPPTLLDSPTTVTISITGSEPSEPAVPHPDEPAVLSPKIAEVQGGWGVSGVIQTTSNPIHNFGIDVFVRDVSGVLFDLALAHPGGLGTLPVSAQLLFDSTAAMHGVGNVIDGPFAGFVIYTSFLEGTSTLEEGARSELQARLSISAARRSEMAELRRRFDESTREIRLQRSSISSK